MVAVSNSEGKILWCDSREMEVVSISGQTTAELLNAYPDAEEGG